MNFWPEFKSGGVVPNPRLAISFATGKPNFDDVGDTMSFEGEAAMECVWCGGYGTHKPDCKALSRNYPKSSLGTQREMTQRLRTEMDRTVERAYYQGSARSAFPTRMATVEPEPPKDVRTDLQKRFDAIAEELEENK